MPFTFEKLHVYQKAVDFTDTICGLTERFPRGYGFVVDQLNRASLSIAANIAEGNGRFTKADRKKFFGIARGSAQECVPLPELARRHGLIEEADHGDLLERLDEIARTLSGWIKGTENRGRLKKGREPAGKLCWALARLVAARQCPARHSSLAQPFLDSQSYRNSLN